MKNETISRRPWLEKTPPRRILAIRLHAIGDVVITLPCLQSLKAVYPDAQLDFLTGEGAAGIPACVGFVDNTLVLKGGRVFWRRALSAIKLLPELRRRRYDLTLDLQRNGLSRMMRVAARPAAFSEFNRFAPRSAAERTREAIEAAGIPRLPDFSPLALKSPDAGFDLLTAAGWRLEQPFVVLNPAGAFPTRRWPIDRYAAFARLWTERKNSDVRFLIMGDGRIAESAAILKQALGDRLLNLVGKTSVAQAFALLGGAELVLSEDSGLMHMAWACGAPTVALLGSTRADWASPPAGSRFVCLNSGDLPCGFCMEAVCRMGDTRCLARYTPEMVADVASRLLSQEGRRASSP